MEKQNYNAYQDQTQPQVNNFYIKNKAVRALF